MSFFGPQIRYQSNFKSDYSADKKAIDHLIIPHPEIKEDKDFIKLSKVLASLIESGITKMGEGYCISVSDIIFNYLNQIGIKCHLEEVKLSIFDQESQKAEMIGHNTVWTKNSHQAVSTHIVVITDTDIPMLIDLSIAHKLPNNRQGIVAKAENLGSKLMASFEYGKHGFMYQEKIDGIGVPQLHQISILDRIGTDRRIFSAMKRLEIMNIIGIFLSTFALINVIGKIWLDWWN